LKPNRNREHSTKTQFERRKNTKQFEGITREGSNLYTMKKRLFFAVLTTFTTVNSSTEGVDKSIGAMEVLVRAHGKASQFLYDELRSVIKISRTSGEPLEKPEITQDRLAKRLLDLQTRHEKVLGKCGPGVEKPKKADLGIDLEGRAGGWGTYQPIGPSFGPSFDFGSIGPGIGFDGDGTADRISGSLAGQTAADRLGLGFDIGGSFGGYDQSGPQGAFAQSGQIGLGLFDPLGAGDFIDSYRRKRSVDKDGKKKRVTRAQINKKIQRLNSSFEPMETFLDTQLDNCSTARVMRLKTKVSKAKARIHKVIKRQGETLLQKQRKSKQRN